MYQAGKKHLWETEHKQNPMFGSLYFLESIFQPQTKDREHRWNWVYPWAENMEKSIHKLTTNLMTWVCKTVYQRRETDTAWRLLQRSTEDPFWVLSLLFLSFKSIIPEDKLSFSWFWIYWTGIMLCLIFWDLPSHSIYVGKIPLYACV